VGDHLLAVRRGRLNVQRGELDTEENGGPAARDHEVGGAAECGQRRVAPHVPDEQPLGVRPQAQ
jgi:hypothetical protein